MTDTSHSPESSSAHLPSDHLSPDHLPPDRLSPENERSLKTLLRTIELTRGSEFTMKLVRCNYAALRNQVIQRLKQDCPVEIQELWLEPFTQNLTEAIATAQATNPDTPEVVLSVQGIEQVSDLDGFLAAANRSRDSLQLHLSFPSILWVTNYVVERMISVAPDLWNFISHPVAFRLSTAELVNVLQVHAQQLWDTLLQPTGELFPQHSDQGILSPLSCREVEAAQRDLEEDEYELSSDLNASLELMMGREQLQQRSKESTLDAAIQHYRNSLTLLQTQPDLAKVGILQIHLGLCCWQQAEGDRAHQQDHWENAKQYFQEALAAFDQSEHPHLKTRFIGYLGETLKRLADWDALESVVEEAIALHQTGDRHTELAQDYGFKAELCLKHTQDPELAKDYAQQSLGLLEPSSGESSEPSSGESSESSDRGLFLLLLAQAEQRLGQVEDAIAHLRQARRLSRPQDNPRLYIMILNELRSLYFEQKEYQTAFEFKRETITIESQYGFRAFIGAGRLQPQRSTTPQQGTGDEVAPEIAVSGRQHDVDKLKERIIRDRHRLTILHGPLGVGKSSILQAGLIPSLSNQRVDTRRVVVVMIRTYTNCQWAEKLGEKLSTQLQEKLNIPAPLLQSSADILIQLERNKEENLVTVLIFDQFEEFFFNCKDISERKVFFTFLSQCLNQILYVNVILSLREDYLHYLLEWERYEKNKIFQEQGQKEQAQEHVIPAIYDNILSQDHRYALGNFSPTDAKEILKTLSERAQFYMEEELCDRLVQDLTINDEVKPIELQVIGVQLQSDNITTLEKYNFITGNKTKELVQRYLERVVEDCGPENLDTANLILYLLTAENNTRPMKTRSELENDLKVLEESLLRESQQIDLALYVFQKTGLIFLIPEIPVSRYQLIHDYLVSFIRAKEPRLKEIISKFKKQREELKEAKKELKLFQLETKLNQRKTRVKTLKYLSAFLTSILILLTALNYSLINSAKKDKIIIKNNASILKNLKHRNLSKARLHLERANDLMFYERDISAFKEIYTMIEIMKAAYIVYEQEGNNKDSHAQVDYYFKHFFQKSPSDFQNILILSSYKKELELLMAEQRYSSATTYRWLRISCNLMEANALQSYFERRMEEDKSWEKENFCPIFAVEND